VGETIVVWLHNAKQNRTEQFVASVLWTTFQGAFCLRSKRRMENAEDAMGKLWKPFGHNGLFRKLPNLARIAASLFEPSCWQTLRLRLVTQSAGFAMEIDPGVEEEQITSGGGALLGIRCKFITTRNRFQE
jgi:hypothetical protein